jgi:PKD repeat protein
MRATAAPNSEVRNGDTFGILSLTLNPRGYDWRFVPDLGSGSFVDSGSGTCHDAPPRPSLAVNPSWGSAPLTVSADASASTDGDRTPISSYSFDFGDGSGAVGPQAAPAATHTSALPGTYTVTVTVVDRAGLSDYTTTQVAVHNGGFEVGTAGWNTSGSGPGIALTRALGGHGGDWAGRLTNTGLLPSTCTLNDSPNWVTTTNAGQYVATLWARSPVPGAVLKLRLREWAGEILAGSAVTLATLTTDWQPISVKYAPAAPGSTTLDLNAYEVAAPPGPCFDVDDVTIVPE